MKLTRLLYLLAPDKAHLTLFPSKSCLGSTPGRIPLPRGAGKPMHLYVAGLGFGLGMLAKYTMAFYSAGLLAGILLAWDRKVLANRHFYYAIGLDFLLFLPNLISEARHGFPVVYHMKALQDGQLQYINSWNFLTDQFLYNLATLFTWVPGSSGPRAPNNTVS
jgi:4-amino-4-deoxy-L-arabinose transferase-like glycosyltransferase